MSSDVFSSLEIDAIGEILNISLGASATAVSTMLSRRVDITTPKVQVLSLDEFEFTSLEPAVGVEITYVSGLQGSNIMLLKKHDVKVICEILMGMEISDDDFELNEMNVSAICEVMNQMMGSSSTALSEFLGEVVNISTPVSFEIKDEEEFKREHFSDAERMVVVRFRLKIENVMESEFMNVMPTSLAKKLISAFGLTDEMITDSAAPAEPSPGGSGVMSQSEIERMLAGSVTQSMPGAAESGGSTMMSQADIEKMLMGGAEPAPAPSSSSGVMSQAEIEKMLMGSGPAAASPSSSGGSSMMSQEDIEKMLMGGAGMQGSQAQMQQAQMQPQMMQPQMMQPQMMQPQMMQPQMQQPQMMQPQMMHPQMQQQMMQPQMQQQMMPQQMQSYYMPPTEQPRMIQVQPLVHEAMSGAKRMLGEEKAENLNLIMGVPLEISVEIGRTKRLVKEILEFAQGSLVVLDKLAGEQVDLYVNGQCIAKGDVVVVDDNFGIRVTEIIKKPDIAGLEL